MDLRQRLERARLSPAYLEEKLKMSFSDAIRKALKEKGFSVKELSRASGISHQHILRILHDESNVTFRTVTKIAVALDYDPMIKFLPLKPFPDERLAADDFAKSITKDIWNAARSGEPLNLIETTSHQKRFVEQSESSSW